MATKKSSKSTSSTGIDLILESNQSNTAKVRATISKDLVTKHRQDSLHHLAEHVTIKGFRKGKAPINLVEQNLDPAKIIEHTVDHILHQVVSQMFTQFTDLKPMANPRASVVKAEPDSEWIFELSVPLMPEFDLGDYKTSLKGELAASKIWTPDQGEKPKEPTEEEKLSKLFEALLKKYQFEVSPVLIEEEINQSLTRLLNQTQSLGLSVEDYLKSIGKTAEQLRQDYFKSASDNLRLEIILARISQDQKIEASAKDIDDLIAASGDDTVRQKLNTPSQRQYLANIISRRKTIDALLQLW